MEKILGVDLDEVLAETVDEVLKHNNYMIKGQAIYKDDISDYYLSNMSKYNLVKEDAVDFFWSALKSPTRENILPVKGAKEKLIELKDNGRKIVVVTARREEISEYTKSWLNRFYDGLIDDILFANHFSENEVPKSTLCKKNGIQIMIEDNLDFAMELASFGVKVYLIDKPWNRHYNSLIHLGVQKVNNWSEISL
ncbi:MAG: HAD hydrolase-like protein [Candidatus Absconditabacteria bacterium]|nr:HAD hydrolase-like protein [Candidatus Absconditabacteria bacterium]